MKATGMRRSSGGPIRSKEVWRIVWIEAQPHGTYTKSKTVWSKWSMERAVQHLEYLKREGADPNDARWRWHQPVLAYRVYHAALDWQVGAEYNGDQLEGAV